MNSITKNKIIVDLLKWVDISIWTAENEAFDNYPIQLCVKHDSFPMVKEMLDDGDVVYQTLDFNPVINDCVVIDLMSNVHIVNNISDELSVVVLSVNEDNHMKFLSLFCD